MENRSFEIIFFSLSILVLAVMLVSGYSYVNNKKAIDSLLSKLSVVEQYNYILMMNNSYEMAHTITENTNTYISLHINKYFDDAYAAFAAAAPAAAFDSYSDSYSDKLKEDKSFIQYYDLYNRKYLKYKKKYLNLKKNKMLK